MSDVRRHLITALTAANRRTDQAVDRLTQPHSNATDATINVEECRGHQSGLARAIETLDGTDNITIEQARQQVTAAVTDTIRDIEHAADILNQPYGNTFQHARTLARHRGRLHGLTQALQHLTRTN